MKNRLIKKLFSLAVSFSVILQTVSPFIVLSTPVYAEEVTEAVVTQETETLTSETGITPTVTPEQLEEIEVNETPALTPTIIEKIDEVSKSEEINLTNDDETVPSAQLIETSVEKVCLGEFDEIIDSTNEDWNINLENGTAETKEPVKLGVKYLFPQENKVSVVFKCLPKTTSTLKIQKIKISDLSLPEGVSPFGEYAYDITTDMQDGTFDYDLALPRPEAKIAKVTYMENPTSEPKSLDQEKINQEGDQVTVVDLNHFTIYFLETYSDILITIEKDSFFQGETVYAKGKSDLPTSLKKLRFRDPNDDVVYTSVSIPSGEWVAASYVLPNNAETGEWDVQGGECLNDCDLYSNWNWGTTKPFNVLTSRPDLVLVKTNNTEGSAYVGKSFVWTLTVSNTGSKNAVFNNDLILIDNLPRDATYSPKSNIPVSVNGVSGDVNCFIEDLLGFDTLYCKDNWGGSKVIIPPGASFSVSINVKPTDDGTLYNPKREGLFRSCYVDPLFQIKEGNEENNNCEDRVTVIRDNTPPKTTIISGPELTTGSTDATFTFTSNEKSTFECKLDSDPWEECENTVSYSDLTGGSHRFKVKATDLAGNKDQTPAIYN